MNRSVKPHAVLMGMLLTVTALLTTALCPVFASPPRVFRVIYNQDCSHVFGLVAKQGRAIKPDDIDRMVDEVVDGGAELMLINPNGQIGRVNYPSRAWQPYWDKREKIGGGLAQMKHLADGGTRLSCPFARQVPGARHRRGGFGADERHPRHPLARSACA